MKEISIGATLMVAAALLASGCNSPAPNGPGSRQQLAVEVGGVDSGGGNGLHMSPAEIADFIKGDLKFTLDDLLNDVQIGLYAKPVIPIRDSRAAPILTQILGLKNAVSCQLQPPTDGLPCQTILETRPDVIDLRMDKACVENGQERDASVAFHKDAQGNPVVDSICVSALRLAQYTRASFADEITALLLHEFSHVAGYLEDDAVFIQTYAMTRLFAKCRIFIDAASSGGGYQDSFQISILRGNRPSVVHERDFDNFLNSMSLTDANYPDVTDAFQMAWDDHSGKLRFRTLNPDGTHALVSVAWDNVTDDSVKYDSYMADFDSQSPVIFSGEPIKLTGLILTPVECSR